ncbi:MAG: hypothetical protein ACLQF4_19585 [Xanthobacteraceae bacterium]
MTVEATSSDRGRHGYFALGNSVARRGREAKLARILAKTEELAGQFGGMLALSAVDRGRAQLAAKHLIIAEDAHDPTVCVRSTRAAELLLSRIKPHEAPLPTLEELGLE